MTRNTPTFALLSYVTATATSFVLPSFGGHFVHNNVNNDHQCSSSGSGGGGALQVAKLGDVVKVTLDIEPSNGEFIAEPMFDLSGHVSFQLGGGGHLTGLDDVISGMEVGSVIENVDIDAGWGAKNPDAIAEIPLDTVDESIRSSLKVGIELYVQGGQKVRVTDMTDKTFTIDANPPMAGAMYTFKEIRLDEIIAPEMLETLTIALGCFWGGELAYMREHGVVATKVGYTQGEKLDPTYKEVCSGSTGHTEAIQVVFNPADVSYERLLQLGIDRLGDSKYLLNQVGNDRGTQYRHGIYYDGESQRKVAEKILREISAKADGTTCQTELKEATVFYDAEDYHQQYLLKGGQSAKKGASETIRCYG